MFVSDAAVVGGYPALLAAVVLRRYARRGGFDRLHPDDRAELLATIAAIERAGNAWWERARGSTEAPRAEIGPFSGEQMIAEEAAVVLGVTTRRVRQLAPVLGGSKAAGGRWVFESAAVLAEVARREASTQ